MTSHTRLSLDHRVKRLDWRIVKIEPWEKRQTVLAEAEDFNHPLVARAVDAGAESTWTAVAVSGLDLGLCGSKAAEDGRGLVLRTYEPAGARRTATATLAEGWRLVGELDLLEDPVGETVRAFTPFQIHSWRTEGRVS